MSWRRKSEATGRRMAPSAPDGLRLYAVGDIHGRADLLDAMAGLIANDLAGRAPATALTVFLGDYVDRGPASSAVLHRIAGADFPTPVVALRGNHDAIFADVLRGEADHDYYISLGGDATLRSYGIDLPRYDRADVAQRVALLAEAVPQPHRAFLNQLRGSVTHGDYFFCHAGVRPGVPLDRQSDEDLMWIRDEFLRSTADLGKIIIHGHTPVRRPFVRTNGIDVDTHAFASGILTAIVLEGTDRRFLHTG